ncbi:MAG: hypothetical protein BMS9Abin22_177 [Gammaproteobacteria bacterium]|nr:MAG: hypothetical protein BMS9Abin22_177 [Gammaproteobacteria bacterium]
MRKVILVVLSMLAIALAGCATAKYNEYDQVVAQANKEIKLAKKADFLWRDTKKILKKSQKARDDGDIDKALKLAKKALKQAQLAQKQAKDQANPIVAFPKP